MTTERGLPWDLVEERDRDLYDYSFQEGRTSAARACASLLREHRRDDTPAVLRFLLHQLLDMENPK